MAGGERPLSTISRHGALRGEAARRSPQTTAHLCIDLTDVSAGVSGPSEQGV